MEEAIQIMDASADRLPEAGDSGARDTEALHPNKMSMTTAPNARQDTTSNVEQVPRDALDDKIDELEQRLAALTADESPSKSSNASFRTAREQMSPAAPSKKALGKRKEERSPTRPKPVLLPQRGSRRQSFTTMQSSSRPTTSHRPSTRRNSTAPTSEIPSASSSKHEGRAQRSTRPSTSSSAHGGIGRDLHNASASSSRRSSFKLAQPAGAQTIRPVRRHQRNDTTWPYLTVARDGRQTLQSVRAFSDLQDEVFSAMRAEQRLLTSSSLPALPHPTTATSSSSNATPGTETSQNHPHEYSNHVPAANIDWTLPSTRRREYEKIDKARRGVRGLIRRVTPSFLRGKNGRMGFHNDGDDGKGSDAGTVRRFRMDVGEGEDGGDGVGRSPWWKFGRKKGKGMGKGKGKGESSAEEEGIELSTVEVHAGVDSARV